MLLLQAAVLGDTVIVRQVPPVRTAFEQLIFVASGLTSILTLLVVLVVFLMLLGMRAVAKELHGKLDEVLAELRPLTRNANAASHDVKEAAAAAKEMVLESRETVSMANERVRETVDNLAERVDDLSDMLARIHHAGERVASVAGTAVGGIKAGARFLGLGKKRKAKPKGKPKSRMGGRGRPRLRDRDRD